MEATVATVVELYKETYEKFREAVRGQDREALNWTPGPETNPVAVLVTHTLGSAAEVFRIASNTATSRDRDAEFRVTAETADALLAQLDAADALMDELGPRITAADLDDRRVRRQNPPLPVRFFLIQNYGHAREHLAHVELTMQMYAQRPT